MTIPIVILPKDQSIQGHEKQSGSTEPLYYVVTSDGLFLRKRNALYDCVHKAEFPKNLGGAKEGLTLKANPVPTALLNEVVAFLAEVCKRHNAEGVAILYYHMTEKKWTYLIPEQETTGGGLSVDYDMPTTPDGYTLFGSIHSHAKASAFQSGTDHKDENNFEGVHITVGNLPDNPSYHVRFHACGDSWTFTDQSELVESNAPKVKVPDGAMEKVKLKKVTSCVRSTQSHIWDDDDTRGYAGDGTVYCQVKGKRVPPTESERDYHQVGKTLEYKEKEYTKTTDGWKESDKKKDSSRLTPTPVMGDGTECTEEMGLDQMAEADTEEILGIRDEFFGTAPFATVKTFQGITFKRTIWGWESQWEDDNGHCITPLSVRQKMYELMDDEAKTLFSAEYSSEMLDELLHSGWTPQDMIMALEVHCGTEGGL